jgi:hypothetical protein
VKLGTRAESEVASHTAANGDSRTVKTEPTKVTQFKTDAPAREPELVQELYPADYLHKNGMDMGFGRSNWLHLTEITIFWKERIKTNLRSVEGRIHGRPDERINPSDSGRTDRNWSEVFRKHTVQRRVI